MEIYSNLKNLFPKWVWCGGLSPQVWSWYSWLSTCLLYCYWHLFMLFVAYHILSSVVEFILLLNVYCFLFWVGWWYLLSTCALYWPLVVISSLLFVECSKRTIVFNSTATLASFNHVRFQGELLFLAQTGFFLSCLDVLKFGHGPSLLLILAS